MSSLLDSFATELSQLHTPQYGYLLVQRLEQMIQPRVVRKMTKVFRL